MHTVRTRRDAGHLKMLREFLEGAEVFVVTYPEYHAVAEALMATTTPPRTHIRYICRPLQSSTQKEERGEVHAPALQFWSLQVAVGAFARQWLAMGIDVVVRLRSEIDIEWIRSHSTSASTSASSSVRLPEVLHKPPAGYIGASSDRIFVADTRTFISAYKDLFTYIMQVYHRTRMRVVPGSKLAAKIQRFLRSPDAVAVATWSNATISPSAVWIGGCVVSNSSAVPWHRGHRIRNSLQPEFAFGFHSLMRSQGCVRVTGGVTRIMGPKAMRHSFAYLRDDSLGGGDGSSVDGSTRFRAGTASGDDCISVHRHQLAAAVTVPGDAFHVAAASSSAPPPQR